MGEDFPYFPPLGRERIFVPSPNAVVNFLTVMSFPLEKEEKNITTTAADGERKMRAIKIVALSPAAAGKEQNILS